MTSKVRTAKEANGDVCHLHNVCKRGKCEFLGVHVPTSRSLHVCGILGAWLLIHKVNFTIERHKGQQKRMKHAFLPKIHEPSTWQAFFFPIQSTKSSWKKIQLLMDNKDQDFIGDVRCLICENENCVYLSIKNLTDFCECIKCKDNCHILIIPIKEQKPKRILFGGSDKTALQKQDETRLRNRKTNSFFKYFLDQSQPTAMEREPNIDNNTP